MHNKFDTKPVVWYEEGPLRITDLQKEHYDEALDFLEKYYLPNKIIFQNCLTAGDNDSEMKCKEIKKQFRKMLIRFMNDEISLIGIDSRTNKVFAVMINVMMINEQQAWDMWTIFPDDPILEAFLELERILVISSVKKLGLNEPRDSLHVFVLSVAPEYKGNNWKIKLLMCGAKLAKDLELPYLTYIGYTINDHKRALAVGMEVGNNFLDKTEAGRFSYTEFENCESVLHLNWLPKTNSQAIYHELNIDKLPANNQQKNANQLLTTESDISLE